MSIEVIFATSTHRFDTGLSKVDTDVMALARHLSLMPYVVSVSFHSEDGTHVVYRHGETVDAQASAMV